MLLLSCPPLSVSRTPAPLMPLPFQIIALLLEAKADPCVRDPGRTIAEYKEGEGKVRWPIPFVSLKFRFPLFLTAWGCPPMCDHWVSAKEEQAKASYPIFKSSFLMQRSSIH